MKFALPALLLTSLISWAEIQSANFSATELGNRWWQHDQFGIFYDARDSNWYYHIDQGWIYVDKWEDNGTWLFLPLEDNNRSNESNSSLSEKLLLVGCGQRQSITLNSITTNWKIGCTLIKREIVVSIIATRSKSIWRRILFSKLILRPRIGNTGTSIFVDDYESYETDLFPDIDVSYLDIGMSPFPRMNLL